MLLGGHPNPSNLRGWMGYGAELRSDGDLLLGHDRIKDLAELTSQIIGDHVESFFAGTPDFILAHQIVKLISAKLDRKLHEPGFSSQILTFP
jgi:hypothetical protein